MNESYENDYRLLDLIAEGNEIAKEILFTKYEKVIKYNISKNLQFAKNVGVDTDDLYQEGLIGLENAMKSYNGRDAKFSTFATLCIDRKMKSLITKANRKKNQLLNSSLSLEYMSAEDASFMDCIKDETVEDPLDTLIEEEKYVHLDDNIRAVLSGFEIEVYELLVKSFSYAEIAEKLDKDLKSIDNAIQRIRKKIKGLLK